MLGKAGGHSNRWLGSSVIGPQVASGRCRLVDATKSPTGTMNESSVLEHRNQGRHSTMICNVPAAVRVVSSTAFIQGFCCVAFYLDSQNNGTNSKSLLAFLVENHHNESPPCAARRVLAQHSGVLPVPKSGRDDYKR
jgi:hypothetical protein